MRKKWESALQSHIQDWMDFQLGNCDNQPERISTQEADTLRRFKQSLQERKGRCLKLTTSIRPFRVQKSGEQENVTYQLALSRLIKIKEKYHLEEHLLNREMQTIDGHIIFDQPVRTDGPKQAVEGIERDNRIGTRKFNYDRRKAVQYAERWWNDYNPSYHRFTDNCTNFISQCLRAGNAPMRGAPNRGKGWWYDGNTWSYSWAVAHSFRWYLSSATSGLTAVEVEKATELGLGDIICYDFNGDGRWQHSTIVTGFDGNEEPLVNAQTSNSRARYWKYEDSTAWTPNIQYKFFRIG